jgi:hypothetical protein
MSGPRWIGRTQFIFRGINASGSLLQIGDERLDDRLRLLLFGVRLRFFGVRLRFFAGGFMLGVLLVQGTPPFCQRF